MKGIFAAVDVATSSAGGRRGMERGRFGFAVAEVGKGGKERISGVRPGMRRATTFWIMLAFLEITWMFSGKILMEKKDHLHQCEANLAVVHPQSGAK